jgi:hypothetical protein
MLRTEALLARVHADLDACRACPNMIGPVVHGPPVVSRVLLLGQAPGPDEGGIGRPFAWTAGNPSGASPWHKLEPGKSLLAEALDGMRRHPAMRSAR